MQVNVAQREIVFKVVYYGPPSSGKSTNLREVHKLLDPRFCSRLSALTTPDDKALFFDLLPTLSLSEKGYRIKLRLFTVPGQVMQAATRRIVLAGADGLIYVACAQRTQVKVNADHWQGMRHYLRETGSDPDKVPTVVQYNKGDLPETLSTAELEAEAPPHPIFMAVAARGEGVLETLHGLAADMLARAEQQHQLSTRFGLSVEEFLRQTFAQGLPQL